MKYLNDLIIGYIYIGKEIADYKKIYLDINGEEPPAPIIAGWTFCDEDKDRAYEYAKRYIGGYWQTVLDHYAFDTGHLKGQKGYEYYDNAQTTKPVSKSSPKE